MRAVALSLALLPVVLMPAAARAEVAVGIGGFNEFLGTSVEYVGTHSSFFVAGGAYQARSGYQLDNLTGYAGYRRYIGDAGKSTYFGGVILGDIDGGANYNRFGAGGELGYQWVTEHLRIRGFVGMAIAGDGTGPGAPPNQTGEPEPQALIGGTVSIRF